MKKLYVLFTVVFISVWVPVYCMNFPSTNDYLKLRFIESYSKLSRDPIDILPQEVFVDEIMSYWNYEDIFRLKPVCKKWNGILSGPHAKRLASILLDKDLVYLLDLFKKEYEKEYEKECEGETDFYVRFEQCVDLNKENKYDFALYMATFLDDIGIVKKLLNFGVNVDSPLVLEEIKELKLPEPLSFAIFCERKGVVSELVKHGAPINVHCKVEWGDDVSCGDTPLIVACNSCNRSVFPNKRITKNIVDELLRLKADPNLLSDDGYSPLYHAINSVERCNLEFFNSLLSAGADPNHGTYSTCVLTRACIIGGVIDPDRVGGNISQVKALLAKGANPDKVIDHLNGNVYEDPDLRIDYKITPEIVTLLYEARKARKSKSTNSSCAIQ